MCMHVAICMIHIQVLSNTVSKAIKTRGKAETEETAKFVDMFNKFFDCLNVSNFTAGMQSKTPLNPLTTKIQILD